MPARHRLDRYDEHGQDTWTDPEEDRLAAEVGQPSTEPNPAHTGFEKGGSRDGETNTLPLPFGDVRYGAPPSHSHYPAVLAQTPVTCQKCGRQAIPFEDVIVCVDGGWFHDECAESHVLDGSTDH